MGIYLPTVSCLIEKTEIPSALPESYHDITHLLEKYWSSEYSYSCTTKGYEHTVFFELLAGSLDLKFSKIYSREVGFLTPEEASYLKADLCKLKDIFRSNSKIIVQSFINRAKQILESVARYAPEHRQSIRKQQIDEIEQIKNIDFQEIVDRAALLKEISSFDLSDMFGKDYHPIISTIYWIKTQIHLLEAADIMDKAFMYVVISSD